MLDLCQNYNKTASALTPANETRLTTAGKKKTDGPVSKYQTQEAWKSSQYGQMIGTCTEGL